MLLWDALYYSYAMLICLMYIVVFFLNLRGRGISKLWHFCYSWCEDIGSNFNVNYSWRYTLFMKYFEIHFQNKWKHDMYVLLRLSVIGILSNVMGSSNDVERVCLIEITTCITILTCIFDWSWVPMLTLNFFKSYKETIVCSIFVNLHLHTSIISLHCFV